jgi:hypothetical protein
VGRCIICPGTAAQFCCVTPYLFTSILSWQTMELRAIQWVTLSRASRFKKGGGERGLTNLFATTRSGRQKRTK